MTKGRLGAFPGADLALVVLAALGGVTAVVLVRSRDAAATMVAR